MKVSQETSSMNRSTAITEPSSDLRPAAACLTLRQNFSWSLAGNVIRSACTWALLIVLAKLGDATKLGQYSLGVAIIAPIITFTNFDLQNVQATDARGEIGFADYVGFRIVTTVVALLALLVVLLTCQYSHATLLVILAVGVLNIMEPIAGVVAGLSQFHERLDRSAISSILKGVLQLVVFIVCLLITHNLVAAVLGITGVSVLVFLGYDLATIQLVLGKSGGQASGVKEQLILFSPRFHPPTLLRIVLLALPLCIAMTLYAFCSNMPRYFIMRYLGERELGIFAVLTSFVNIGYTGVGSLIQSVLPKLAKHHAADQFHLFRMLLGKICLITSSIGLAAFVIACVAGREVISVIYNPEYVTHMTAFCLIMASAVPLYLYHPLSAAVIATRHFFALLPLVLGITAATAVLCLLLIPRYGINGAAVVITGTAMLQLSGCALILGYLLRRRSSPQGELNHDHNH